MQYLLYHAHYTIHIMAYTQCLTQKCHTHCAILIIPYPLCRTYYVIHTLCNTQYAVPIMSGSSRHTHYAIFNMSYPLCNIQLSYPLWHTHNAIPIMSYPICHTQNHLSKLYIRIPSMSYPVCHNQNHFSLSGIYFLKFFPSNT